VSFVRQEIEELRQDLADARAALDLALRARDNWRKANDEKLAENTRLREAAIDLVSSVTRAEEQGVKAFPGLWADRDRLRTAINNTGGGE
jgi:hypothetical protein